MLITKIKLLLFLLCLSFSGIAKPVIVLNNDITDVLIGKQIELFVDKTKGLTIQQVLTPEIQAQFKESNQDVPSFGTNDVVVWCKFTLKNETDINWVLQLANPYLDSAQLFIPFNDRYIIKTYRRSSLIEEREIHARNFMYNLVLAKGVEQTYYVRARNHICYLPLRIGTESQLLYRESKENVIFSIFFGMVLIITVYNLILYMLVGGSDFIYNLISIILAGLYSASYTGMFVVLMPNSFVWATSLGPVYAAIGGSIFIGIFGINFIDAKRRAPLFYKICLAYIAAGSISVIVYFLGWHDLSSSIAQISSAAFMFIITPVSFRLWKGGISEAIYLLVNFLFTFGAVFIGVLFFQGVLTYSFFAANALSIGIIFNMITLSLGIGYKINSSRKEKYIAQLEKEKLIQDQNALLEKKVDERTRELEAEKHRSVELLRKSDELLLNILPSEIAEELKHNGRSSAKTYSLVTVMFIDFKDFTTVSERVSAELLVAELDYCFSKFDEIIQEHGLEKIKTVGDAYICAGGMPALTHNHATEIVRAALDIRDFMTQRRIEKEAVEEITFEARIGIHSGPVVAGIVGKNKFAFDIWGDTVNTAARMEQNSEAGKINISQTTYELVKTKFDCKYRGELEAKNKGMLKMYFVNNSLK